MGRHARLHAKLAAATQQHSSTGASESGRDDSWDLPLATVGVG